MNSSNGQNNTAIKEVERGIKRNEKEEKRVTIHLASRPPPILSFLSLLTSVK